MGLIQDFYSVLKNPALRARAKIDGFALDFLAKKTESKGRGNSLLITQLRAFSLI